MTAADDLRATAGYIREVGLAKGTAEVLGKGTSVCTLGGIARVCDLEPSIVCYNNTATTDRYEAAVLAMKRYLRRNGIAWSIPTWSDTLAKDEAEVTATLEKAAAWTEEQA